MRLTDAEAILETYSLEELLDLNELTEADVLKFLVDEEFIELPDPLPLSF